MATRFETELDESPEALRRLVEWAAGPGARAMDAWTAGLRGVRRVIALGMGTSLFAPSTMRHGLARGGVRFHAVEAGEWLHAGETPADGERLLLCSQSGASAEIVRLVERGLPDGTAAITNEPDSPLGRAVSPTLLLQAGEEAAISTKTYVNTLALGHLLGAAAAGDRPEWLERLREAAAGLHAFDRAAVRRAADALAGTRAIACVGRTEAAPAVHQLALTVVEGAAVAAVPFVGGSFRHGPLEACGRELGVVSFAPPGPPGDLVLRASADAARLGSPVVVLSDRPSVPAGLVHLPAPPGRDPQDFALRASRVQAHLVQALAAARGREAGVFLVNSKVTTTE